MNLEYAAYLLNENQFLTEDADGEGRSKAKAWLKKNYPYLEFGEDPEDTHDAEGNRFTISQNGQEVELNRVEYLLEHARTFFGHWLYNGLRIDHNANVSIYKYLPGAVRVAFTDCGWYSNRQDNVKLNKLRYIYAAAYIDWIEGQQQNPNYKGKVTKDFTRFGRNGQPQGEPMSYNELLAEFEPMFAHVDEKFAEATARVQAEGGAQVAVEEPQETEEQRLAREERERIDNSTAGQYHIEYIPTWDVSKEWCKYTNPTADQAGDHFAGARWCITEIHGHWNAYQTNFLPDVPTIYYCWKAESKEALLEMNDHVADYDGDREIRDLPFSEYGLSLICIMVTKDRSNPGNVKFLCATSRYNHCDSHGNRHLGTSGDDKYFGDQLCIDGGKAQVCQILGITEAEFNRKFKPLKSENGGNENGIDHTRLNNSLNDSDALMRAVDNYSECDNHLLMVEHQHEYNYYNFVTKQFISPTLWFTQILDHFTYTKPTAIVRFNKNGGSYYNIIDSNGNKLIEQDVPKIDGFNENYVKIGVVVNGNYKYNVVNRNTGMPFLKKPYDNVRLAEKYGVSIPVYDNGKWKFIDFKGKIVKELASTENLATYWNKNIYATESNDKVRFYSKKTNRKLFECKKREIDSAVADKYNGNIIIRYNGKYNIINPDKGLLLPENSPLTRNSIIQRNGFYVFKTDAGTSIMNENGDFVIENAPNSPTGYVNVYKGKYISYLNQDTNKFTLVDKDSNTILENTDYSLFGVSLGNDIIPLRTLSGKYNIYDVTEGRFLFDEPCDNYVDSYKDKFIMLRRDGKYGIVTADGVILSGSFTDQIIGATYINEDCILASFSGRNYNIFTLGGKKLCRYNFKRLVAGFNNDGFAIINAGVNNYFINTYGDVSRVIENITESMYTNNHNPIINENKYSHWLHKAAFLLD